MKKFYFAMALLGLAGAVVARAGTNTLATEVAGKIQLSHINKFKTALTDELVPRNSSGVPTNNGGSLGSSTYRWNDVFAASFVHQRSSESTSVAVSGPVGLVASYNLTWPAALPGSTLPMLLSSSGAMSTGTITSAQITDLAVDTADLAANAVTTSKITNANVTQLKIYARSVHATAATEGNILQTAAANATVTAGNASVVVSGTLGTQSRPTMVCISGTGSSGNVTATGSAVCRLALRMSSSDILAQNFSASAQHIIAGSCVVVTPGTSATTTFDLQLQATTNTCTANNLAILAYEIN